MSALNILYEAESNIVKALEALNRELEDNTIDPLIKLQLDSKLARVRVKLFKIVTILQEVD